MSETVSAPPGFLPACAILDLAASSPGLAVAMLLGIGTTQGRGAALSATLNLLTLVGVGLVLTRIAWAMFLKAMTPTAVTVARVGPAPALRHLIAGYALQVTNPKAIVFWLAIASRATTQGAGPQVLAAFKRATQRG